ncbi:MAG: hypothetical protein GMKNLPBB_03121 [Myxococcota bacterium]|nr:hypothetical protein [Myxococcota bacterium]
MKLVIPMAGRGSRFAGRGVTTPKPLIEARGRRLFQWALKTFDGMSFSSVVFIALREHEDAFGVTEIIRQSCPWPASTVLIDGVTEGQLCTVLAAREHLESADEELIVFNADSYVEGGTASDLAARAAEVHGLISVVNLPGDRWSFARANADGDVVEVAEKRRISDHCSTGLYHFASAREFLWAADQVISRNLRTNNEFYVIPVYGMYLERGWRIRLSHARRMWDLGTPESLAEFERNFVQPEGQQ